MKISIIHPSRSRPEIAKAVHDNWIRKSTGKHDIEWHLSIDNDDPELRRYTKLFCFTSMLIGSNNSAIEAINRAALWSTGDILIVVSDDFDCPENWDEEIVKAAAGRTDWIMKTQDGTQGWIITLPIMDRKYYERFGYIYCPEYLHMFCDTEMTAVADLLGRKITANIHFQHNNGIKDKVAERANATWNQGKKVFLSRQPNFGLSTQQIKGKITDEGYRTWIKSELGKSA